MSDYPCELCGACCRSIGKIVISAIAAQDEAERTGIDTHAIINELAGFPYDIRDDGSCSQYDSDSQICKVYASRPVVCRTDEMYDRFWSKIMSKEAWYAASQESCRKLRTRQASK